MSNALICSLLLAIAATMSLTLITLVHKASAHLDLFFGNIAP